VIETEEEKLADEKEALGYYVSGSPLDSYGKPEELSVTPISEIDGDTYTIFGLITNIEIKQSKKTGNDMAFISVQDQTGTINVSIFQKAYEECRSLIKEGNVLVFTGKVEEDDFGITDEDGEVKDVEYRFIANTAFEAKKKNGTYLVHSDVVNMQKLESMREENGSTVYIYDVNTKRTEKLNFKVSSEIKDIPGVVKMS